MGVTLLMTLNIQEVASYNTSVFNKFFLFLCEKKTHYTCKIFMKVSFYFAHGFKTFIDRFREYKKTVIRSNQIKSFYFKANTTLLLASFLLRLLSVDQLDCSICHNYSFYDMERACSTVHLIILTKYLKEFSVDNYFSQLLKINIL